MNSSSKMWMGAALGFVALLLIIAVAATTTISTAADPGPPPPNDVCANVPGDVPTYFAYQAPPDSNHYGPAAPSDAVAPARAELHNRLCLDSALTVPTGEYLTGNFVDEVTRQQRIADANANRGQWLLGVAGIEGMLAEAVSVDIELVTATYWTMYAIPQNGGIPLIQQSQEAMVNEPVLRFTFADGTVKRFKLNCGYQPVEPEQFPGVPLLGAPAPPPPVVSPPGAPPVAPPVFPPAPPVTTPEGKQVRQCPWGNGVCIQVTDTTRPAGPTTAPPPPPPPTPDTTLVPDVPDHPTCEGGTTCPSTPPVTYDPPAPQPTTSVPRTTPPTTPGSG